MTNSKEWLDEPDREEFEHAGYKCLILRHDEMGHLCGYVGVPKGHLCYGKSRHYMPYEDLLSVSVHGGLTYSEEGDGIYWALGYWWFGFDCAHAWDQVPLFNCWAAGGDSGVKIEGGLGIKFSGNQLLNSPLGIKILNGTYRNFQYVRGNVKRLAEQLADLDFIDWQFKWVWPLLLPVRTARWFWTRQKGRRVATDETG